MQAVRERTSALQQAMQAVVLQTAPLLVASRPGDPGRAALATAMNPAAAIAASRFGLGPRPGDLDRIAADPRGWLAAQLADPTRIPAALAGDGPAGDQLAQLRQLLLNRKAKPEEFRQLVRAVYLAEASARTQAAIAADNPVRRAAGRLLEQSFHRLDRAKPIVRRPRRRLRARGDPAARHRPLRRHAARGRHAIRRC